MPPRRLLLLAGLAIAAALAVTGVMDSAEDSSIDARFAVRGAEPVRDLAVVAIDEATFNEIVPRPVFPFRRKLHADAIDALRRAGARQIVYDVQFSEPSDRPADDLALYAAVKRAPGTILATGEIDARGRHTVLGGERNLRAADARAGAANLPGDGVVRRYERQVSGLETLATAVAQRLGRAPGESSALIDFRGPPGTIPTHSFSDVLAGRVADAQLRDRVVVVGATAATLQDLHPTAAPGGQMSGPEIQANAIWTALNGNPLRSAAGWLAPALTLLYGLLGAAVVLRLGAGGGIIAAVALGGAHLVAAQLAFESGTVIAVAAPLAALLMSAFVAVAAVTAAGLAERRRVQWRNRELEHAVAARTAELERSQLEVVDRLARTAELRDDDTGEHVDRMSRLCERVALELDWTADEAGVLRRAAALHDIGKVGVPDAILRKPGRLDELELGIMREHTTQGGAILAGSRSPVMVLAERIALTHHEKFDGTGYPAGLVGDAIPLEGRIAAVCDVFDALVSARPYKRAWSRADALAEIADQRGRHFDPAVADALIAVVGREPTDEPAFVASLEEAAERQPTASGEVSEGAGRAGLVAPSAR